MSAVLAVLDGLIQGNPVDKPELIERNRAIDEARTALADLIAERDRYENALYIIANGDLRPGCIGSITKARMAEIARAALARVSGEGA